MLNSILFIITFMYKEIDTQTIQKLLRVDTKYSIDSLITYGGHPKHSSEALFEEEIKTLFPEVIIEDAFEGFFQDVRSCKINSKRIWFCVTYGGAMTSEIAHIACLLGAKTVLHGGSCGALQDSFIVGDIFLPATSYGDESCTRMYNRNGNSTYTSDSQLRETLVDNIATSVVSGKMLSIQAMLAETREDIDLWSQSGYQAVDLETATVFAVANHFNVPAAAMLYIADNLITEELVHTLTDEQRTLRKQSKHSVINALIKTACI